MIIRDEAKESLQSAIDGEEREKRRMRSEVEGFKRSIVGQHRRNEQLAQQVYLVVVVVFVVVVVVVVGLSDWLGRLGL